MSDKKNAIIGKQSERKPKRRAAIVESLEARTLYSADILGGLLDTVANADSYQDLTNTTAGSSSLSQAPATEQIVTPSNDVAAVSPVSESTLLDAGFASALVAEPVSAPVPHELVIIDSNTPNYQQIVDDILAQADAGRHIEFVMLDPTRDGLEQLNELFATYSALDAVHLISHGSAGAITLGDGTFDLAMLQENANQISRWSSSFNENGDFLIYGCDLAASPDGQLFINTLSQMTGADVAASDNLTGSARLGGDWSLEYATGAIESHLAVSIDLQDTYNAVLVNTAPVLSGANSFTAINEDNTTSSGTLVSALIAGKVSDVDGGVQGIAIIAVNNTNGSWQYTTDGSTWNAVGTPNQYNALLLAADGNNAVRFVPNANYNGTVTNGITYYAWDQSTGVDGTTASTIKTDTYRDNFTTQTYTNSDGTQNWTTKSWTEVGDGTTGPTSGDFTIRSSQDDLSLRAANTGDYIWREANLSGALTATVSFSWTNNLQGFLGHDEIQFQVRASSADAWTTRGTFTNTSSSLTGDITGFISSTTQVRFVVTSTYSLGTGNLYVDNFQISYDAPGTGGTTAFSTTSAISGITVNPVNDAPVNTVPVAQSLNEDVSTALSGISINDVDGNLSSAQLSVSQGKLTVSLAGGATISAGANSSSVLTLSGTQAQINAALGTLAYLGNSNFYGSDTLTVLSTDGNGATDSDTMAITVNNVNDPITITSSATVTAAENQNIAYTTTVFNPDPDTVTYSIDNSGTTSLREDNAKVSINASTGVVTFLSTPNFESPTDINPDNIYHIKIKASDNNGYTNSLAVAITITNANDAPTGVVSVSGTATENQILTASNTLADQDGLGAISYQWQRNGTSIPGAIASTYTLGDADVGAQIKVVASYTDGGGFATSVSSTSVGPVTNVNDVPVGVPTITGTVTEDQTLTANTSGISDADGLGAFSYQWLRNGAVISGATATTYVLGDVDVGANISVRVTYTDAHGTAEGPLTSAATAAVANVNDVPVGLPLITGTLTSGQTLSADTSSISDADGLGAFTYQWMASSVDIAGATSSTYSLVAGDVGAQISVKVIYTDGHGTAEMVTSALTTAVTSSNVSPVGSPAITGLATENQILTADTSGISDADGLGAFSYQWLRDGAPITGATASTYTLVNADVSALINVRVGYTDGGGTTESLTSAQTGVVANVNDLPVGVPIIVGTATENQTLTADTSGISDEDGLGAFSYQWLRNNVDIAGATASTYALGDADVGANISVRVIYTDGHSTAETLTSAQTAAVTNVNDAPVGLPSIDGVVTEDQILTANTTAITDADGLGAFTYQWFRNGATITGATVSTYALGDADVGNQISLQVSYTDGHGTSEGPLTSSPTTSVVNINDAPTLITLSSGVVDENTDTSAGYSMGGLTTTDADVGDAATYAINGGADASFFSIGGAGFNELILTNGILNFEAKPSYTVTVRVTDTGGLFHDETFTVNVVNVNEVPVNTVPGVQTVAEDTALAISGLSVNDVDGNLSTVQLSVTQGTLSVSLAGGASISAGTNGTNTLTLSGTQIQINTALSTLSYQGNLNYNGADTLTVLSTDSGGVPLSDSDPVAITVTAVNDAPVGVNDTTALNTSEDTATGTLNATLLANDSDVDGDPLSITAINGTALTGGVQSIVVTNGTVNIDASNNISFTPAVNYNGAVSFSYTISDGTLTSTATVSGTVTAVNDAPVFTSAATVSAAENQTAVLTVTSTDVDGGAPAYTISGGADSTLFSINSSSGVLTFNTAPNFEVPSDSGANNVYDVVIQVSDGNGGLTTQAIAVTVTNVNEAPVFTSSATANAAENQTAVLTVTSTDVDGGAPAYTISGGADSTLFSINSSSGVLTFNTAPNFEVPSDSGANNVYDVVIQVSDGNGGLTTQAIAVTVTNVNEAPVFTSAATVSAAENQTAVLTVTSTDVDGGAPAYTISGGADSTLFSINSSSGVLTFNTAPNFEVPSDSGANNVYDVVIQVSDGNGGLTTQAIAVTVTNVNEVPVNTVPGVQTVAEDTALAISGLSVNDVDGNLSTVQLSVTQGTLSVSLAGGASISAGTNGTNTLTLSGTQIQINTALSTLSYQGNLNYNGADTLTVLSTDSGGVPLSDSDPVAITVTAVNDAPVGSVTINNVTPLQGDILTASNTLTDVDGLGTISYQWQRNGVNIAGATGATYTTVQADVGTTITTIASYTDGFGALEAVASGATAAVTNVNDIPTGAVIINNLNPAQGALLTASNTLVDADGLGTISYQWQRNGVNIAGASGATYTTVQADVGAAITVAASYTDGWGSAERVVSAATGAVVNVNDVPVFGGSSSGVVIKNVLSNGSTLLETRGLLSIADPDVGESSFQATTVNGVYGQLTITAAGDWIYLADNAQSAIQQLMDTQALTDTLSVTSFDGTAHAVVISIQGSAIVPVLTTTTTTTTSTSVASPDATSAPVASSVIDKNILVLGGYAKQNDEQEHLVLPYVNRINTVFSSMVNDASLLVPADVFAMNDGSETAAMQGSSMKDQQAMRTDLAESKFIQLNKLDINWFKSNEPIDTVTMSSIVNNHPFINELYQLHRDLDDSLSDVQHREQLSTEVSVGVSISLTAGIVSWLLRGGSLLASFMSVAPFWKQLDPLPILGADAIKKRAEQRESDTPDDEEDAQIEDIFDEDKT